MPDYPQAHFLESMMPPGTSETPQAGRLSSRLGRLVVMGIVLVGLGLGLRSHYKLAIVSGSSMLPTLTSRDVLVIDKQAYEQSDPGRGDIVVARGSDHLIVKRVVGPVSYTHLTLPTNREV